MDEFNSSEPPLNISGVFENGQDAMSDPTTLHSSQFTSFEVDSATIIPSGGEPSTGVGNLTSEGSATPALSSARQIPNTIRRSWVWQYGK